MSVCIINRIKGGWGGWSAGEYSMTDRQSDWLVCVGKFSNLGNS